MKVEVKPYLPVGLSRLQHIKVYKYEDVKDLDSLENAEVLYDGEVDDAPRNIRESIYVKCELGNPCIYYI